MLQQFNEMDISFEDQKSVCLDDSIVRRAPEDLEDMPQRADSPVRVFLEEYPQSRLVYSAFEQTNINSEMRSFKSNENIHKKEGGSYYVVSANKASSVTV